LAKHSLHPVSRAVAGGALEASDVVEHPGQGVDGVVEGVGRLRWGRFANPAYEGSASLEDDHGWVASFDLDETLRPGAAAAVAALQREGLRTEILSGDAAAAVQRLAHRVGIRLARGGQSPQDKLEHLAALQQSGRRVAMVGDGLNDGPVLAQADVAIAVGDAVPLAQARCDFIVPGGQPAALALLLRQARRTRGVVRQNLAWAAVYNAVCVPLALAGLGMAASSLFVVLNAARLARLPEES
jgi:Cu2+-exporting ATPase